MVERHHLEIEILRVVVESVVHDICQTDSVCLALVETFLKKADGTFEYLGIRIN